MRDFGNLSVPKIEFKEDLIEMDKAFREFHLDADGIFKTNDLHWRPGVIADFLDILIRQFHPKYPINLLRRFAKGRTFFRLRHLQRQYQNVESFRSKRKTMEYSYAANK